MTGIQSDKYIGSVDRTGKRYNMKTNTNTTANTFGLVNITNQGLYASSQKLVNLEIESLSIDHDRDEKKNEVQRKQAAELHNIVRSESFKASEMTIKDYVLKLELPTMTKTKQDDNGVITLEYNKSVVSGMITAGSVYNDPNAPESLKKLPWSILAALSVLNKADTRKILFDKVNSGELTINTQKDAKTANDGIKEIAGKGKKPGKAADKAADNVTSKAAGKPTDKGAETFFTVSACVNGEWKTAHDVNNGVAKIAYSVDEAKDKLFSLANVANGQMTPHVEIEGAWYGAVVNTLGQSAPYRLTPMQNATVELPPKNIVKGSIEAVKLGVPVDPQFKAVLDICQEIGYGV